MNLMTLSKITSAFLCVLAISLDAPAPSEKKTESPRFTCEFRKKDDTFTIEGKPGSEEFRIHSVSGIGSVTITRRAGDWPKTVVIRFQKMQMLEQFTAKVGKTEFSGTRRSAEKGLYFDKDGKQLKDVEGSVFSLTIATMEGRQGIEVRIGLPAAGREVESLGLDWIDAFRG